MKKEKAVLILILIGLLLVGGYLFFSDPEPIKHDSARYETIALNLSKGRGFTGGDPGFMNYQAATFSAPLYPWFLGLTYRLFGHHNSIVYGIQYLLYLISGYL